jgi:hypothetical protein
MSLKGINIRFKPMAFKRCIIVGEDEKIAQGCFCPGMAGMVQAKSRFANIAHRVVTTPASLPYDFRRIIYRAVIYDNNLVSISRKRLPAS